MCGHLPKCLFGFCFCFHSHKLLNRKLREAEQQRQRQEELERHRREEGQERQRHLYSIQEEVLRINQEIGLNSRNKDLPGVALSAYSSRGNQICGEVSRLVRAASEVKGCRESCSVFRTIALGFTWRTTSVGPKG